MLEKHMRKFVDGAKTSNTDRPPVVLVPLCGKTYDMPWLGQQGFDVVGVEGVPRAINDFRNEQKMRVKGYTDRIVLSPGPINQWSQGSHLIHPAAEFQGSRRGCVFKTGSDGLGYYADSPAVWHGKVRVGNKYPRALDVIEGDMFEITPELVAASTFVEDGHFDFVYDRGALDAVPPAARQEYVAVLSKLLKTDGRVLLVVLEYDQEKVPIDATGKRRTPPPFSVPTSEVHRLFPQGEWGVECLERRSEDDIKFLIPAFSNVPVKEVVYLVTKRKEQGGRSGSIAKYIGGSLLVASGVAAALILGRS